MSRAAKTSVVAWDVKQRSSLDVRSAPSMARDGVDELARLEGLSHPEDVVARCDGDAPADHDDLDVGVVAARLGEGIGQALVLGDHAAALARERRQIHEQEIEGGVVEGAVEGARVTYGRDGGAAGPEGELEELDHGV